MYIDLVQYLMRATLINFVKPRGNPIHTQCLAPPIQMCVSIMCLMPISDVTQCVGAHAHTNEPICTCWCKGFLKMTTNSFQGCFKWQPLPGGVPYPSHVQRHASCKRASWMRRGLQKS